MNVQQREREKEECIWCEIFFLFYFDTMLCLLDIVFISRKEKKVGCFENTPSWAAVCLPWTEHRERINILRICQRKRGDLCLCAAFKMETGEESPSFLKLSSSLWTPHRGCSFSFSLLILLLVSKVTYTWKVSNHLWKLYGTIFICHPSIHKPWAGSHICYS
jgi:hypothetical protein